MKKVTNCIFYEIKTRELKKIERIKTVAEDIYKYCPRLSDELCCACLEEKKERMQLLLSNWGDFRRLF